LYLVQFFLMTLPLHCATSVWRVFLLQGAANFLQDPQFPLVCSFGSPHHPTARCRSPLRFSMLQKVPLWPLP
jgi:hypothetical protein